jgi:thiol-disulfide isomerase/thioredoxin
MNLEDHTRTRLRGVAFVLLTAAVVLIGGWALIARDSPPASSSRASSVGKVIEEFAPGERTSITRFQGTLLDGDPFDSDELLGRVSVFNVWGSWCGPCRTEAPDLVRVADESGDEVAFVGINVRDNPDAARAFERQFEVPYPSVAAEDSSQALLAFGGALASAAVPSTVVLDRDGRIAARVIGPVTYSTLSALVASVVAEAP